MNFKLIIAFFLKIDVTKFEEYDEIKFKMTLEIE
jgi:hypothetical protein